MVRDIFWCDDCNIPLISNYCFACKQESTHNIGTNLKPVFIREQERYKKYAKECMISTRNFPNILFRKKNQLISDISRGSVQYTLNVKQDNENTKSLHFRLQVTENLEYSHERPRSNLHFLNDKEYMSKL